VSATWRPNGLLLKHLDFLLHLCNWRNTRITWVIKRNKHRINFVVLFKISLFPGNYLRWI